MTSRNLHADLATDHTVIARTVTPKSISTSPSGGRNNYDFLASNNEDFSSFIEDERKLNSVDSEIPTSNQEEELVNKPTPKDDKTKEDFLESIRQIDTIVLVALVLLFIFEGYVAYKSGVFKIGK